MTAYMNGAATRTKSMTRRRSLLCALVAVVVALAGIWLLWPRTALTRETEAAIQTMSSSGPPSTSMCW
jgi:multidrug resistance efflux pump